MTAQMNKIKVKKLGHCCLLIETESTRILTDPGTYSTLQDEENNIDLILITHEHTDHLHVDSLKKVLLNNKKSLIVTNKSVGAILEKEGIDFKIVSHKQNITFNNILIEGFGEKHAEIYSSWNSVENTGYFISNNLFYPGDALTDPEKPVNILALPVAGPWMKISESIDYALKLKPKHCFPVHDGILKQAGLVHRLPFKILPENGIEFVPMLEGDEKEF
jgi:L-ascorbate metabolism protein UlaG (beta-lactamase superfamily)